MFKLIANKMCNNETLKDSRNAKLGALKKAQKAVFKVQQSLGCGFWCAVYAAVIAAVKPHTQKTAL